MSNGTTRRTPDWVVVIAMLVGVVLGGALTVWATNGAIWGAIVAGAVICPVFAIVAGVAVIWRDDLDV